LPADGTMARSAGLDVRGPPARASLDDKRIRRPTAGSRPDEALMLTLFHFTHDPEAIMVAGFVDGDGSEALGRSGLVGVVLSGAPG
jgi:hypothetical protein